MNYLNKLIKELLKGDIKLDRFNNILEKGDRFFDSIELETELLLSNGFPLSFKDDDVVLTTLNKKIEDQTFCIVDIETTAGNPKDGNMLEIGAIKYKNGKIIESYQSLVNTNKIPDMIQNITGITPEMTHNAPNLQTVLEEFKIFLEDDIFVAHNISFDYKFISDSFKKYNLGELCNRRLCTIELSKRLIDAPRYGLKYLTEQFNIELKNQHRAYDDALCTQKIFQICLDRLPKDINSVEKLIKFTQSDINQENKGKIDDKNK